MTYQYTLTLQDYKDAQRTFSKVVKHGRLRRAIWSQALPALGVFAAVLLLVGFITPIFRFSPFVVDILSILAWFGMFTLAVKPMAIRRAYRQMKNGRLDSEPLELELAGDELITRIPGVSEGRFRRAAFTGATEDENIMMLFLGERRYMYLSKRGASPECLHALRIWLLDVENASRC